MQQVITGEEVATYHFLSHVILDYEKWRNIIFRSQPYSMELLLQ